MSDRVAAATGPTGRLRAFAAGFAKGPAYPASSADRRTVRLVGLDLPLRATTAIVVVTLALLFDFSRTFIPAEIQALGRTADALRYQALERAILFGLVPALIVVLAFRGRLTDYGLGIGDWRWGLGLAAAGCTVMTPIVIAVGSNPQFSSFYGISGAPVSDLLVTHLLDLVPAEFLMRGFVMFTLLRTIGPLGLVVAQLPFVFAHLGKPEIELFSTLLGGAVFGWLDWRTRSIWWSALGHVYVLTLIVAVAGAARAG
ncbi:MAG TPA: CPBP family intramembrane glutamic endopeptidase [Candidatus Sulfomarinibacteraceae bacterium]|nr:CPBP family intramembrane glutamic endopeptidase [Candidatus Sulfomarinibacteraceae bacterium]